MAWKRSGVRIPLAPQKISTSGFGCRFFYCIGSGDAETYSTLRVTEGVAFQRRRCGHRGGILRGPASVVSVEIWKARGGLRGLVAVPVGDGRPVTGDTDGTMAEQNSPSKNHAGPLPGQNSPCTPLLTACAGQNSPCSPKMAQFGAFCPRMASFLPLSPPTSRAWRTFSRSHPPPGRVGRAFSHQHPTHTPDSGLTHAIAASCSE